MVSSGYTPDNSGQLLDVIVEWFIQIVSFNVQKEI